MAHLQKNPVPGTCAAQRASRCPPRTTRPLPNARSGPMIFAWPPAPSPLLPLKDGLRPPSSVVGVGSAVPGLISGPPSFVRPVCRAWIVSWTPGPAPTTSLFGRGAAGDVAGAASASALRGALLPPVPHAPWRITHCEGPCNRRSARGWRLPCAGYRNWCASLGGSRPAHLPHPGLRP